MKDEYRFRQIKTDLKWIVSQYSLTVKITIYNRYYYISQRVNFIVESRDKVDNKVVHINSHVIVHICSHEQIWSGSGWRE